ncbi:MAG: SDR family NAD(P)-dependent oxidoreductase [Acetatifactor sp.]
MNIIIITGASSGIGKEFAIQLDNYFQRTEEFWLIARREEKLQELSEMLNHKTRLFPMDMTKKESLDILEKAMLEQNVRVRMLINCAGFGMMGAFMEQPQECAASMIQLNCEALTNVTHRVIPFMQKNGRIIQMASCAAFLPQPDFAVYAATKAYVLSLSRALREELKPMQLWVTAVCPGPVDTPFFEIAEKYGSTLAIKKYTMVSAEQVVRKALRDSKNRKALSVCSLPIKAIHLLSKILPQDIILECMNLLKKKG